MKFYVKSTRYDYNVANILLAYPNISNYSKEEIVKEVDNGKNIQYRLTVYFDTAADIMLGSTHIVRAFNHTRKCRKNQEDSFRKIKKLRRGGLVRGSGTKVTVIGALNKSVSACRGNLVTLPKMQKSPRSAEQKRHCAVLTNN